MAVVVVLFIWVVTDVGTAVFLIVSREEYLTYSLDARLAWCVFIPNVGLHFAWRVMFAMDKNPTSMYTNTESILSIQVNSIC